ncbi:hypothetical protein ES707_12688 [subsurface metagenome]
MTGKLGERRRVTNVVDEYILLKLCCNRCRMGSVRDFKLASAHWEMNCENALQSADPVLYALRVKGLMLYSGG